MWRLTSCKPKETDGQRWPTDLQVFSRMAGMDRHVELTVLFVRMTPSHFPLISSARLVIKRLVIIIIVHARSLYNLCTHQRCCIRLEGQNDAGSNFLLLVLDHEKSQPANEYHDGHRQ